MTHNIRTKSKAGKENLYELTFSGGVKPAQDIGGRDRITNGGKTAAGRVVTGVDGYEYWGAQESIEATDPEDLLISVNGGAWKPSTKFGATEMSGGSSGGSSSGGSSGGSTGGSSDGGWGSDLPPENPDDGRYGTADGPERGDPAVKYVGEVGSPLSYTTEPMYRYIDPVDGDDSWPGTRTDPLQSISEFVARLPGHALHGVRAILKKGVYDEGPIHFPHVVHKEIGNARSDDTFAIGQAHDGGTGQLNRDDREDVVIKSKQIGARLIPYSTPNEMGLHDVKLEGCWQNRWGASGLRGVTLDPEVNHYRQARGFDTYGGWGFVWDCDFVNGDNFVNVAQNGIVELKNCRMDNEPKDAIVDLDSTHENFVIDSWNRELPPKSEWF